MGFDIVSKALSFFLPYYICLCQHDLSYNTRQPLRANLLLFFSGN
jgi:hypothetical protein